ELETSCSCYCQQGLHEGFSVDNIELSLILSEINLSDKSFMKIKNFETKFLNIDKSKQVIKLMQQLDSRIKKLSADPSNDKRKQQQKQCNQINGMFGFYEDKFKKFMTKELFKLMHSLFVIETRI
ncbi:23945_t:CDS:2, partial [Gigaspora margarita]